MRHTGPYLFVKFTRKRLAIYRTLQLGLDQTLESLRFFPFLARITGELQSFRWQSKDTTEKHSTDRQRSKSSEFQLTTQ